MTANVQPPTPVVDVATQDELDEHAATPHGGGDHPDLTAHDTMGLATDAALSAEATARVAADTALGDEIDDEATARAAADAAEATARANADTAHAADTTDVHGIADTADLLTSTQGDVSYEPLGGGTIAKIALSIGVSSGNISVAAYPNVGAGVAAVPGARLATSGAVACPAAGWAEVSLGASVEVAQGSWFALTADNTTATFLSSGAANPNGNSFGLGQMLREGAAHPAPANPGGSLAALTGRTWALQGVA